MYRRNYEQEIVLLHCGYYILVELFSVMWKRVDFIQSCDWLCSFQNGNPADGCCVAIGFLPSSSGAVGHFRLHDD